MYIYMYICVYIHMVMFPFKPPFTVDNFSIVYPSYPDFLLTPIGMTMEIAKGRKLPLKISPANLGSVVDFGISPH